MLTYMDVNTFDPPSEYQVYGFSIFCQFIFTLHVFLRYKGSI